MNKISAVAVAVFAALIFGATPAKADPPPPGCARVPLLGLNPQILEMCDSPILPDGSWERARRYWHPQYVHSSCGGVYYYGGCPQWAHDVIPAERSGIETYTVTADTIPPGEPGHIE
ncbi:hypothetical protein KC238_25775 [Mycobacteroides chelonae]|uniref:CDGP domain-containing protein n=1 Tax=Mycobacteroides TaxID=670516 RepID=UPI0009A8B1F8|nr:MULTISPECIES: hypothetical protein [Mycobacteroides]MBV0920670.1 hypothetical protein [Mycobacteroides chelonae]SKR56293.1 Uncharacterised protein [Mycobacteroides abscessus subsp. abscessus]